MNGHSHKYMYFINVHICNASTELEINVTLIKLFYCINFSLIIKCSNIIPFTRQFFYHFYFQELIHEHTYMTVNFQEELQKWADYDYYEENVHKIQLPFTLVSMGTVYAI